MPIGVPLTWTSLTLLCTPMPDRVHVFLGEDRFLDDIFTPGSPPHLGISRGMPRFGVGKGFRLYRKLNPGPWFTRVETADSTSAIKPRSLVGLTQRKRSRRSRVWPAAKSRCSAATNALAAGSGATGHWQRNGFSNCLASGCLRLPMKDCRRSSIRCYRRSRSMRGDRGLGGLYADACTDDEGAAGTS